MPFESKSYMDLTQLKNREGLGEFLNANGLVNIGVEVGTLYGEFMETIMNQWQGVGLYCIDPWEKQPSDVYREPVNDSDWHEIFRAAQFRASKFPGRVALMPGYSPEAASAFRTGEFDFVYIDARHDFNAVHADLRAWWPKVRNGGLFSGHDYRVEHSDSQCCDVKTAVDEFCSEMNLPAPHFTPSCQSWWMEKR